MWDKVKLDIFSFVCDFMRTGKFPQAINMTWVALIRKILQPMLVDDFRPNSLVRALYKTTSKLLSMKLRAVLALLIAESQSAFGRQR